MADLPDFIPDQNATPSRSTDLPAFIPDTPRPTAAATLSNRATDTDTTGTLKNIGTTAIKGLAHIPGFAGDLSDLSKYLMARVHSGITGIPVEELQRREQEFEQRKADFGRRNLGLSIPGVPSGPDIAAPILAQTGEYHPTTEWGRIGAAAGETGLSMLGPGGLGRALRSGEQGLSVLPELLKGGVKAVPGGAVAGAAGDTATQVTGDPLAGMAASAVVPSAVAAAKPLVRPFVAPMIPSMRPAAANRMLAKSATDPKAALDTLAQRPAKPGETLGEATLDPGILQAEKGALSTSDHFKAALTERDAARAEQRKTAIEGIAPPANPLGVRDLFRQRLADIDQATQDAVDRATAQAKTAHQAIPGAKPAEVTGEALRNIVSEADKAKGAAVSRLYQAIDPDGTLSLVTTGPRETAAAMHKAFDPTVSEPNTATPIIGKVANLPDVMPFQKLMELDKTITSKMAEAARSGDRVGHGQLIALKGAVQHAVDNALENQAKWQEGAVARGELQPEQTNEHNLTRDISSWYAERNAGADTRALAAGDAAPRSTAIPRAFRGQGEGRGESGVPEGDQGVPELKPNFDAEAAGRLAAAKQAHAERAQTYRQGPVAPVLKTTGFADQYAVPAAKVPAAAFPKGDIGYSNARAFLRAAGDNADDALAGLQDIAVSRLRDVMPEGELTPKALAKWKQDYGPALRAIDERVPGFSDRFSTAAQATDAVEQAAATRKAALADAQKGVAAKFMNLTNPNEVGDRLMGMVKAKDGPTQIKTLLGRMAKEAPTDAAWTAAEGGMRHALAQAILRDHQNADGMLSGAKLRNFITDNQPVLEAAFGKGSADVLGTIAEDAERYQQAAGIQRSKLGSDSFANFMRWAREKGAGHASLGAMMLETGHLMLNGEVNIALGAAGAAALGILRARGVRKVNDLVELGMTNPEIGRAMMQSALDAKGQFNTEALEALAKAVARASAENQTLQEHSRIGRASGGKVSKVDYAAKAMQLIRLAEKAKKAHGHSTSALLKMPDELIAGALRLANRG